MAFESRSAGVNAVFHATTLRTLTRHLGAANDHDAILETILDSGPDGLRPSPALLAVRGADGGIYLAARSEVPTGVDLPSRVPEDAGIPLVQAMRGRAPLWIESEVERDRWFPELRALEHNPSAGAILPLEVDDDVVGAIGLFFWHEHRFTESERQHYQVLADLCALAVDRLERIRPFHLN